MLAETFPTVTCHTSRVCKRRLTFCNPYKLATDLACIFYTASHQKLYSGSGSCSPLHASILIILYEEHACAVARSHTSDPNATSLGACSIAFQGMPYSRALPQDALRRATQ